MIPRALKLRLLCRAARLSRVLRAAEARCRVILGGPGFPGAVSRADHLHQRLILVRVAAGALRRDAFPPARALAEDDRPEEQAWPADPMIEAEDLLGEMAVCR